MCFSLHRQENQVVNFMLDPKKMSHGPTKRYFFCNIFVLPLEWDFSSKIRKLPIFALILDKFCIQNLITSLKVVRFTLKKILYDPICRRKKGESVGWSEKHTFFGLRAKHTFILETWMGFCMHVCNKHIRYILQFAWQETQNNGHNKHDKNSLCILITRSYMIIHMI